MSNYLLNKIHKKLTKLEKEVELATSHIPEGYQVAKDTLSERVKLMAEGLKAYSRKLSELAEKNRELESDIEDMHYQQQMGD